MQRPTPIVGAFGVVLGADPLGRTSRFVVLLHASRLLIIDYESHHCALVVSTTAAVALLYIDRTLAWGAVDLAQHTGGWHVIMSMALMHRLWVAMLRL